MTQCYHTVHVTTIVAANEVFKLLLNNDIDMLLNCRRYIPFRLHNNQYWYHDTGIVELTVGKWVESW